MRTFVREYCIAAIGVTVMLLLMYGMKRNYKTHQNRVFFVMLLDNLLASSINLLTFETIMHPELYPPLFNFMVNAIYLLSYTSMGVLFLLYIDSMTKIGSVKSLIRGVAAFFFAYLALVIFTSYSTHLVIYFDENNIYSHGPLMHSLYLVALVAVLIAITLFVRRRNNFNLYQTFAIIAFGIGVFAAVVFQRLHPSQVISNYVCSLVLLFLYTAFENQAYHLYGDTPCYNRTAFIKTIHNNMKKGTDYTIYALRLENYESALRMHGISAAEAMSMRAAERISRRFGKDAYALSNDRFVVLDEQGQGRAFMISELQKCFDQPVVTHLEGVQTKYNVIPHIAVLPITGAGIEGYEADALIQNLDGEFSESGTAVDDVEQRIITLRREKSIITKVDKAVRNREFLVYYQPIYDVATGTFKSAEALIRLKDEKEGFISPEEFIPVSEKSGRIVEIGDLVFREVCRFIKEEKPEQYGVEYIEVNLSPIQCRERFMSDRLMRIMEEYGVSPSRINLEITETSDVIGAGTGDLEELLVTLHEKGVTFSIDDFGSGFAAVDYLINLPVDIIKIDKSILWQAVKDEISRNVLTDTMRMIKRVGREIVVEGVETREMVEMLRENGCDYMQGYYYSKPVSGEEYILFLKKTTGS